MRADWNDWMASVAESGLAPGIVWTMTIRVAVAPTSTYCHLESTK